MNNSNQTIERKAYLELAIAKALGLLPNTQIRVTSDEKLYWVFNDRGTLYIGYDTDDMNMIDFFQNQKTLGLVDKSGRIRYYIQRLLVPTYCKN
jgi:hypothetical protein